METYQPIFHFRLIKSEFTDPLDTENNPNDINFNFSLRFVFSDWLIPTRDSPVGQLLGRVYPPVSNYCLSSVSRPHLGEARTAMEEKLRDVVVNPIHRRMLVDYAYDQAIKCLESSNNPTAENGLVLNLHFGLLVLINRYIYLEDQSFRMVPAADSSVEGLKRAAVADYVGRNMSCSICLEEFSGEKGGGDDGCCEEEALLSMPCSHVFHGDCIKKWLSVSHYCPLCRLELPTSNN